VVSPRQTPSGSNAPLARVAYLGPEGTFAEEAVLTQADLSVAQRVPMRSVIDVVNTVEDGECALGLIPLENSIEGSVNVTLDSLAFDSDLLIQREIDLQISLHLAAKKGTKLGDVSKVVSHPNPLGQSRLWLHRQLPQAVLETTNSTAEAAKSVSKSRSDNVAAICTRAAAQRYGLAILASDVQDHSDNETRFVLIGRGIPAPTGRDKTSIVCFQREDRPGSLLAILAEFASRSINLTKLESRPAKQGLGQYCFFIDFEGHVGDELVTDCLRNLSAKQAEVKFLGSYPVAGTPVGRRRSEGKRWKQANDWLASLRAQIRAEGSDA